MTQEGENLLLDDDVDGSILLSNSEQELERVLGEDIEDKENKHHEFNQGMVIDTEIFLTGESDVNSVELPDYMKTDQSNPNGYIKFWDGTAMLQSSLQKTTPNKLLLSSQNKESAEV